MTSEIAVKFAGQPTGPVKFVAELGVEVGTFTEKPEGKKCLMWHVPFSKRGIYRPTDLANYVAVQEYRVDAQGFVLCYHDIRNQNRKCARRAENRYPRCTMHGGQVHPLDKVVNEAEANEDSAMSRYKQFLAGLITVEDLDDEELAACGFRAKNGVIFKPRNVPRELSQQFHRSVFDRANDELRSHVVEATRTLGDIMRNKKNEPDIRMKAALAIIERNLGKTATNIVVSTEKPFEEVFDDIESGSRAAYRKAQEANTIDAECEPERSFDPPTGTEQHPEFVDGLDDMEQKDRRDSNSEVSKQNSGTNNLPARRGHERHSAIVNPILEVKDFEYDLSGESKSEIKADTNNNADYPPDYPLVKHEEYLTDGTKLIRYSDPDPESTRKTYSPNDF